MVLRSFFGISSSHIFNHSFETLFVWSMVNAKYNNAIHYSPNVYSLSYGVKWYRISSGSFSLCFVSAYAIQLVVADNLTWGCNGLCLNDNIAKVLVFLWWYICCYFLMFSQIWSTLGWPPLTCMPLSSK